jgi:hypothetical protein
MNSWLEFMVTFTIDRGQWEAFTKESPQWGSEARLVTSTVSRTKVTVTVCGTSCVVSKIVQKVSDLDRRPYTPEELSSILGPDHA